MKLIPSHIKYSSGTVDYYQLSSSQKTEIITNTKTNLDYVKTRNDNIAYKFDDEKLWGKILPRRSPQSPIGPGQNNPHQFIDELAKTKSSGDFSGKQITAINHINQMLDCKELVKSLPAETVRIINAADDYEVEYKIIGKKKQLKNVKHEVTGPNTFSEHFTFGGNLI